MPEPRAQELASRAQLVAQLSRRGGASRTRSRAAGTRRIVALEKRLDDEAEEGAAFQLVEDLLDAGTAIHDRATRMIVQRFDSSAEKTARAFFALFRDVKCSQKRNT